MKEGQQKDVTVLIIGADGQLGRAMRETESRGGRRLVTVGREALDIAERLDVIEMITKIRPDWVINAAAYTAVDRAEDEPRAAFAVNRDGAGNIAEACAQVSAKMVQVSTDYVFDGTKGAPYLPSDETNPLNVYGESKLAGERKVRDILGENALILRTAWVYSLNGPSFLTTMLRLMSERSEIDVVEDQVGSPTSATSLAKAVLSAVDLGVTGLHHWSDAGVASWYDFAVAIAEEGVANGLLARMPVVNPIPTRNYPTVAPRPKYTVLDKSYTRPTISCRSTHWRDALRVIMCSGVKI